MNFMMSTVHWMSLVRNVILFRQKSIKTAISWDKEMIRSFIMTARIITFEIEQEDGSKKYGKSKEHRPNPIIQMGLFMDGDGIPLAFSLFPGNANEQTSLKPLEKKVLGDFGCQKFIYCSDAGLGSEAIREYNHMGEQVLYRNPVDQKTGKRRKRVGVKLPGI